jgi:hypothetical protein
MPAEESVPTQAAADRLSARLQAIYDTLPADERAVVGALVQQVAASLPDVAGYALGGLPVFVGLVALAVSHGGSGASLDGSVKLSFSVDHQSSHYTNTTSLDPGTYPDMKQNRSRL